MKTFLEEEQRAEILKLIKKLTNCTVNHLSDFRKVQMIINFHKTGEAVK